MRSVVVAAALALAACGGTAATGTTDVTTAVVTTGPDATPATESSPSTEPSMSTPGTADDGEEARTYVDERGVEVTIESTDRIIPLDGDIAEVVFALGAGDRVVATDLSATFPAEADALPQIGYQRALNAEPILAFEPTLLIGTDIAGPPTAIEELERVGIPVAIVPTPADASGPGTKIRAVAEVLGIPDDGERLAAEVEAAVAAVEPLRTERPLRVAMLYLRGDNTQLVFGTGTSIHWLIEAAGAVNVAAEMGITDTAEITAEALTVAAPDVLLVTEDGLRSVGGVEALVTMPAVAGTPAAAAGAVLAYDAQFMLGNGPRTGEFLARLVADLTDLPNSDADRTDTDQEEP